MIGIICVRDSREFQVTLPYQPSKPEKKIIHLRLLLSAFLLSNIQLTSNSLIMHTTSYSQDTAILIQVVSYLKEALKCRRSESFQTMVFPHQKICKFWKIMCKDIVSKPHWE